LQHKRACHSHPEPVSIARQPRKQDGDKKIGRAEKGAAVPPAHCTFHGVSGDGTYPCSEALEGVALSFDALLQIATHAVENLLGAWTQAIGVAVVDFVAAFVNDARFDAAPGHPVRSHQASWTGTDDEAGR
jgi:hypothetical protein